jgi:hypothetical protein
MFEDDPEAINYDNYGVIYRQETYTHQMSSASLAAKQPNWRDKEALIKIQQRQAKREQLKASFSLPTSMNDLEVA